MTTTAPTSGPKARRRARRGAALALAALAAVTLPGSPVSADADTRPGIAVGRFSTLPAGTDLGYEIEGLAGLGRTSRSTFGFVIVLGLQPGVTYAAHLHNQPCGAPNPGGGHYVHVPGGGTTPPNELWFSSSGDPTGGITATQSGVAVGRGSASWVARPDAQAVVIHAIPAGGTTAGGPKIACANL